MTEQALGNRITLRAVGEPSGAPETHVTDLPTRPARYVGSDTPGERQTRGPINMVDLRGLLEEPPHVKIAGELVEGEPMVLIKNGIGVHQLADRERELMVHVPELGEPVIDPKPIRRAREVTISTVDLPPMPAGSRARYDRGAVPLNGRTPGAGDHLRL